MPFKKKKKMLTNSSQTVFSACACAFRLVVVITVVSRNGRTRVVSSLETVSTTSVCPSSSFVLLILCRFVRLSVRLCACLCARS